MLQGDSWEAAGDLEAAGNAWRGAVAILDSLQLPLSAEARSRLDRLGPRNAVEVLH
jgi:hypothetical protein